MTVNAVLFFGQDDVHFTRLDWALFSCWRAMLGDWDWAGLARIGREKAFIWFFLFLLIIVLILTNILVSILMEAYATVKGAAENADSLFGQVRNMMRRAKETRERKRVRMKDIEDALLQDADHDESAMLGNSRLLVPQFKVHLDRHTGEPHGLETVILGKGLIVSGFHRGLIETWNSNNRVLKVAEGDTIVEVNGVRGEPNLLLEELNKKLDMTIRLRRSQRDQELLKQNREMQGGRRLSSKRRTFTKQLETSAAALRHRVKRPLTNEPAFLMDMVPGIPESQAKRTLKNSLDADEILNGAEFSPDLIRGDLSRMLDRVSNSILCAGWLGFKLEEYEIDDREKTKALDASMGAEGAEDNERRTRTNSKVSAGRPDGLISGIQEVRRVAEQRTWELADDVATVLGEEMQALERRQKEQQRGMTHTQESLQGLRHMVYKLNETCEEVSVLTMKLLHEGSRGAPATRGSSKEADMEEAAAVRAKLLGNRKGPRVVDDMNFHGQRFGNQKK